MLLIKKNIWIIFYILFVTGIILLSIAIYNTKIETEKRYIYEQENIVKISANSIKSIFSQYEMLLNILASQLKDEHYQTPHKIQILLDSIIADNPSILNLTISTKDGEQYVSSTNVEKNSLINLLNFDQTRDDFLYTISTGKMIIGRTYFMTSQNKLAIPIRKSFKDAYSNVKVISANIDLSKGFDFLLKNTNINNLHETFLFRDFDYYFQISPSKHDSNNPKVYSYKIPIEIINKELQRLEDKYQKSIKKIKEEESIVTINSEDGRDVLSSSTYLQKYELWLTTQLSINKIYKEITHKSLAYTSIFIFVLITLYILFRYIDKHEKSKQKILYHQATHDYLTNLHNRLYLSNEFEKNNKNKPYTLFFIDMDNFKNINDNYGHIFGDIVLKEIANRLNKLKRTNDLIIRHSGDEFIFISSLIEKEAIEKLALKIIDELSSPYYIKQYKFILGSSIGISQFPKDGSTLDDIKRYADIAMYEAKKIKNTYSIFENSIKEKYLKESLMEEELRNSLINNEIYMMYQPQVTNENKLYGVEALVRWNNKKFGFVPPDVFIKIAENSGFMDKLGEFIIQTSLKEIKEIQEKTDIKFQLSINISVKQFLEINFYSNLFETIQMTNFDKNALTLEVTESTFIEDINLILDLLQKIKQEGVKISLDDFGTGYSSLSLLKKLPIDELKIDKSFVDDILIDKESLAMVENIIAIGKNLNMYILAEGVETTEQKDLLINKSCDLFQGIFTQNL